MAQMNIKHLLAAASLGLACSVIPSGAQATHSWSGYHWARTTPQFTLKLGDNLSTADWSSHLGVAASNWNNAGNSVLQVAVVKGTSKNRCSMVLGTTQVCNGSYGNNGWLGLATIYISDGTHITKGSAKMNDTYFNTATYHNTNERQHVMCQEVAHTFGLDHQSTDGSSLNTCMDYFSNTGSNATSTLSTAPNAHDFEELGIIYSHLDSTTTVASMTASAAAGARRQAQDESEETDDPSSWGTLIRQSGNGRSSIYERHNRDGSKTLTHVFWTIEAAESCHGCDHRFH